MQYLAKVEMTNLPSTTSVPAASHGAATGEGDISDKCAGGEYLDVVEVQ
jgi:hypothetical protein